MATATKTFQNYHEAVLWERENEVELIPTGDYGGNEDTLARWWTDGGYAEVVRREKNYYYYPPVGSTRPVVVIEYVVVFGKSPGNYDLYHANCEDDALRYFLRHITGLMEDDECEEC